MSIELPFPLTVPEMRLLQEYRRLGVESLSLEAIRAIKHPTSVPSDLAQALVAKGFLTFEGETFSLAENGKRFLERDVRPADEPAVAAETP